MSTDGEVLFRRKMQLIRELEHLLQKYTNATLHDIHVFKGVFGSKKLKPIDTIDELERTFANQMRTYHEEVMAGNFANFTDFLFTLAPMQYLEMVARASRELGKEFRTYLIGAGATDVEVMQFGDRVLEKYRTIILAYRKWSIASKRAKRLWEQGDRRRAAKVINNFFKKVDPLLMEALYDRTIANNPAVLSSVPTPIAGGSLF